MALMFFQDSKATQDFQEVRISKADNGMRQMDRSKYHRAEWRKTHKNRKPRGTHIPATFFLLAAFFKVFIGGYGPYRIPGVGSGA